MGTCKNCGSGELTIAGGFYTCKTCGYTGSLKEWLKRILNKIKA